MIELRNKQYMTVIDCLAGANLEVGQVIGLENHGDTTLPLRAVAATQDSDVKAVTGPLLAHWINERSTTVAYSGGENGLTFPLAGAADDDAQHYIPSGKRMVAIGGKGVAEVRVYTASLDSEFASTLPVPGQVLHFSTDESKLCSAGNVNASTAAVAMVLEADAVSVAVILG